MKCPATSLLLSGALLLGSTAAQAALPDETTLYKNPQCGCCDDYAHHLEEMGVSVTIVDDVEVGSIKLQAGLPYGLGACHTTQGKRTTNRSTTGLVGLYGSSPP